MGFRHENAEGKIPGVVYSNNDSSAKGSRGETFLVKVDKIVLDREIRRLKASFDNTVSFTCADFFLFVFFSTVYHSSGCDY